MRVAASRARRPLLAGLALLLAAAAVGAMYVASWVRERAIADAVRESRLAAQLKLTSALVERDLQTPADDERFAELRAEVERLLPPAIQAVTLWAPNGRILFHEDPAMIGTRPTYPREFLSGVAKGSTETKQETGLLKVFVPVWVEPGGAIAVAQLDRPLGPITTTSRIVQIGSLLLAVAAVVLAVRFALTFRTGGGAVRSPTSGRRSFAAEPSAHLIGPRPMAAPAVAYRPAPVPAVTQPATPSPPSRARPAAEAPVAAPAAPGGERLTRERDEARTLAEASERRVRTLEAQHRQALEQINALETRLAAAANAPHHAQQELQALRDQVRDSAERLYRAEEENRALKVRLEELEHPLPAPDTGLTSKLNEIAQDRLAAGGAKG